MVLSQNWGFVSENKGVSRDGAVEKGARKGGGSVLMVLVSFYGKGGIARLVARYILLRRGKEDLPKKTPTQAWQKLAKPKPKPYKTPRRKDTIKSGEKNRESPPPPSAYLEHGTETKKKLRRASIKRKVSERRPTLKVLKACAIN